MRCPNCHSVVGNNYGLCQYCGYDIGEYVKSVQDISLNKKPQHRDQRATAYTTSYKEELTSPQYNYENGFFYYKRAYEDEKERNEKFRRTMLYGILAIVLVLHIAEILALAVIYMS